MKNRIKNWLLFLIAVTTLSTAIAVVVPSLWRTHPDPKKTSLNIPSWAPMVKKIQPAVVVINTEAVIEQDPYDYNLPGPFRYLFPPSPERQKGQGSGFIINEDGLILTNQHVIEGAQMIKVRVGLSAVEYDAKVLGADEALDVALLKIILPKDEKNKKWPFLYLGDSDKMELGAPVMAVSSPYGLDQSVTPGWLVHDRRKGLRPSGRDIFPELFQFFMGIGPGSSGSPIVNDSGEVIAISESVMAAGPAIAFGVPINFVKNAIPQLEKGSFEKAYLGIEPQDLTPEAAKALGLNPQTRGAIVVQVYPDTPAEKAGLKAMDVILEMDGKAVPHGFNLRFQTAYSEIGKEVIFKVYRKGVGFKDIKARLERRPSATSASSKSLPPEVAPGKNIILEKLGMALSDLSKDKKKRLGLKSGQGGAEIISIVRNTPAHLSGLLPGDIILRVGDKNIDSAEEVRKTVDKASSQSSLLLITRRGDFERFVYLVKP